MQASLVVMTLEYDACCWSFDGLMRTPVMCDIVKLSWKCCGATAAAKASAANSLTVQQVMKALTPLIEAKQRVLYSLTVQQVMKDSVV